MKRYLEKFIRADLKQKEDLQVNYNTVKNWLNILENLFVFFRIHPFGSPKIRAVKKEVKAYLWDWSLIKDEGRRFENFVACQLKKYCDLRNDADGENFELRYLRDTNKREIDFVVLKDNHPLFAVECKVGDQGVSKALGYFSERTPIPSYYQVHMGNKDYQHALMPVRVLPFHQFAKELKLP